MNAAGVEQTARLDSGAEAILLRQSTAERYQLPVSAGPTTTVVFGNGQSSITNQLAQLGQFNAIVCNDNDLHEDLISVNPLLDAGYRLTMDANRGTLINQDTGSSILVLRDGARWSISIDALSKAMSADDNHPNGEQDHHLVEANAVIHPDASSLRDKVISLHERLGHANLEAMCDAIGGNDPAWTHCDVTPTQVRRVMKTHRCLVCLLAKRPRPPISSPSGDRKDMPPGFCISGDIIPVNPPAHDGSTMFYLFADVRTGYMLAFTGKSKDTFLEVFKQAVAHFAHWGHQVKVFRSDAETVLKDGRMGQYLNENNFIHELSTPESHYQNFVERYVQTITKFTSALLHGQDVLHSKYWNWALFHAIDCRNRVPNSKCRPMTPYEMITGLKTNVKKTFQFTFGDIVAVHVPKDKRSWKFDLRWDIGIYVGQPPHSVEAATVYFPFRNQILVRTDVAKLDISEEAYKRYYFKRYDMHNNSMSSASRLTHRLEEIKYDFSKDPAGETNDTPIENETLTVPFVDPEDVPVELHQSKPKQTKKSFPRMTTRSLSSLQDESGQDMATQAINAFTVAIKAFVARASGPEVREALNSILRDQWIIAMADEIIDGMINTSKTLVPEEIDKSKAYKLIHTTMQLKIKMKTDTIVDKLKARLCACGNELEDVDNETYSPTVSNLTHSFMLQIAVHDRMHVQLIDTKAAYLCQDYPEDATPLYVKLPKRVSEAINLNPNQTYRVRKYIYGLPDAGRAYYDAFSGHLLENGFTRTVSDLCLFYKVISPKRRVYVWSHVDDTLIAADLLADIEDFKRVMTKRFEITVNAEADHHLGVNIEKLKDGSLKLKQSKLLKTIFSECSSDIRESSTRPTVPLKPSKDPDTSDSYDKKSYLHLLGMLNYLLRSRPDIATALSYAASKASNPTVNDYKSLIDIVQYLWQTKDHGLHIRPGNADEPLQLKCFVDASFLSHADSRGHSGYCIAIGDLSSFYSKSNKQQLVATSSTHAEVKALYQLITDLIFLINLCDEIGRSIELPAIIFEDNNPAVQLSGSLSSRIKRSKHFLMLINFIRHHVMLGLIEVRKVATEENVADVLTKPLSWREFRPKAARLLGIPEADFEQECSADS